MIYREWFSLRFKLLAWLAIYGGWAILFLIENVWFTPWRTRFFFQDQNGHQIYQSLFDQWLSNIAMITPVLALLGGVDLFSEEKSKQTISFLLTHPISRVRIYSLKLLLTGGVLVSVISLTSLIVLIGDRIPKSVYNSQFTLDACQPFEECFSPGLSQPVDLLPALTGLLLILLVAALVIFNAGVMSIYCHSILKTGIAAAPVLFLCYTLLYGGGRLVVYNSDGMLGIATGQIFTPWFIVADISLLLSWSVLLLACCTGVFIIGSVVFNRKSF